MEPTLRGRDENNATSYSHRRVFSRLTMMYNNSMFVLMNIFLMYDGLRWKILSQIYNAHGNY
jgi:hypothetical protein